MLEFQTQHQEGFLVLLACMQILFCSLRRQYISTHDIDYVE